LHPPPPPFSWLTNKGVTCQAFFHWLKYFLKQPIENREQSADQFWVLSIDKRMKDLITSAFYFDKKHSSVECRHHQGDSLAIIKLCCRVVRGGITTFHCVCQWGGGRRRPSLFLPGVQSGDSSTGKVTKLQSKSEKNTAYDRDGLLWYEIIS
jgi:hypothetical protein